MAAAARTWPLSGGGAEAAACACATAAGPGTMGRRREGLSVAREVRGGPVVAAPGSGLAWSEAFRKRVVGAGEERGSGGSGARR